ncbi:MAG: hypothetical protein CVU54_05540 [Deltaproteobacteria bacterium HGW-Deltaproteobacteria-12]|jgi:ferredoxin hydrogenase large subunit|nr:MAG: hypothetical protein CVU54_05540 [Deltaproteobacteria bacterium HGW-Deltaproteobacteria-12]
MDKIPDDLKRCVIFHGHICPARVRYVETQCPELIPHLSSAKSPQQMAGSVAKTYGTKVWNKPASQIFTVGIMPCTAKKFEASRPEFTSA